MNTALDRIIAYKHAEVAALKAAQSEASLIAAAEAQPPTRGFACALTSVAETGENALICEMKRKSPSAGEILPGADPVEIARDYETGGAACLSVLTDGPSFGGSLDDFAAIRAAVSLPMLRKDFMIDPVQVHEARANGADAILVILACTEDALARDLLDAASAYGMDTLIETHTGEEVTRAVRLSDGRDALIGINNRDLKRMVTDLGMTEQLAPLLPAGTGYVAESGIAETGDIVRLRKAGARRFLIGESLMKRPDRSAHCAALRHAA
ncbi:MAG: indole-3-glycerol phosphate synthase TrpC [Pseudomonadota bacterium]